MGRRVSPGVEKLDRQRYRLWWTDPRTHKECSTVFRGTKADAVAARAEIVTSISARTYVTRSKTTVGTYARAWLRAMKLKDDVAPSTHARYSSLLLGTLDDHLGGTALQDLCGRDIDAYYLWALEHETTRLKDSEGKPRHVSPATVTKRHQALKMMLSDAVTKREIARNPADDASPPKRRRPEGVAFSLPEARLVLERCEEKLPPQDVLAVKVALFTGLRIGEVLALRNCDVGPGAVTVAGKILEMGGRLERSGYPKSSHSRRTVTIDPSLAASLKAHVRAQGTKRLAAGRAWEHPELVFTTPFGGIMRPNTVSGRFTGVVRPMEADKRLTTKGATFHSLRHTHATELLHRGVPVSVVSKRLGHKDELVTLLYYSHVLPGDDAAAASVFASAWVEKPSEDVENVWVVASPWQNGDYKQVEESIVECGT